MLPGKKSAFIPRALRRIGLELFVNTFDIALDRHSSLT